MPFSRRFSGPLFASLAAFLLAALPLAAQIHEQAPPPGLEEGVLVHLEKRAGQNKPLAAGKAIGAGDFSVVCRLVLPAEMPQVSAPVALVSGSDEPASHDRKAGWKLMLGPEGTLSFTAQTKEGGVVASIDTLKGAARPGRAHDVVVSVHREARQPLSGISVDGIELASGVCAPADLRSSLPGGDWDVSGWIKSVTVYDRALTRPEILELTLRGAGADSGKPKPQHPAPPANGPRFVPQQDETIALVGGTEAVALSESGELEVILMAEFPQTRFHFRNLAWEGDTVFKQDRPMNYGDLSQQLRRVNAGTVFLMFGRQECLERGKEGLTEFRTALEKMIETVRKQTSNIVIFGPPPFEKKDPPLPDLSAHNDELPAYVKTMGEVAAWNHFTFIDPADAFFKPFKSEVATTDGVGLTPQGCFSLASNIAQELNLPAGTLFRGGGKVSGRIVIKPGGLLQVTDPLLPVIQAKNRLWHDYWRPSNWAFLHGDRTNQPSSRDPVNPQIRLFPSEQETLLPMIQEAEEKIYRTVEEATKKLP